MSCVHFSMNGMPGIMTVPDLTFVKYGGYFFEWHPMFGPTMLRKDGEPAVRQPQAFFNVAQEWFDSADRDAHVVAWL